MYSLANTFSFLDNPSINWKSIILGFSLGQFVFEQYIEYRQLQVLKRKTLPASIKAEIDQETFEKSKAYRNDSLKFNFINSAFGLVQSIAVLKFDLYPKLWSLSGSIMSSALKVLPKSFGGEITQSIFFFITTTIINSVISLPFDYYQNFVLEEKHGFNKMTVKLWVTDTLKSLAVTLSMVSPFLALFFKVIDIYGDSFVFMAMVVSLVTIVIAMTVYPLFIAPLFYKFTPLEDNELKAAIEDLAKKNKFPLSKLYVIDGSKRSSHSNAYFTGLPWSKQIVLFDTLIKHSSVDETVAVLAHEIGHWKLSHLPKLMTISQVQIFILFSLYSAFYRNESLYSAFGFVDSQPKIIGFHLFESIHQPVQCLLQFTSNLFSRKFEYEADSYAKKFDYTTDLSRALIKLQIQNLSTMDADWLYSSYHHSHPILADRLEALGYVSEEKIQRDEK